MLGLPTKEFKEVALEATKRLEQIDPVLRKADTVLAQHQRAMDNLVAITDDLRAISSALRAAIVREP